MSPVSLGSFVLIFLSSVARIAPSATGTLYDLLVRVSFISSALLTEQRRVAWQSFLTEQQRAAWQSFLAGPGARLALFFLGAAGGADEPVFGILFSS